MTSAQRIPIVPDVPTAKEQGADIDITMWRGLAAPAGTPDAVIKKLEAAAKKAVDSKEFQDASKKIGFKPAFLGHKGFDQQIAADDKRIAALMGAYKIEQAGTQNHSFTQDAFAARFEGYFDYSFA